MKKALLLLVAAFGLNQAHAQMQTQVIVKDSISTNTHWDNDHQYLLKGWVYVTSGAILTIDSGVVIKGEKNTKGTLIVERGAQIFANGTKNHPIVFTSDQPSGQRSYGDWGGLMICGNAPTNWGTNGGGQAQVEGGPRSFYGGSNPHDNSGRISYIRLEFPGIALSPNNEVNGLTLCGVGDGTQIDHVMVTWSGDDGFEFFGGTVNAKYLISHRSWDDDFDTDCGYQGKVQFGVVQRDPLAADISGSHGFESDAYQNGTYSGIPFNASWVTSPVFSNMTIVGPLLSPTSTANASYVSGLQIRRGSSLSLLNSLVIGWPAGLVIDESASSFGSTTQNIASNSLQFQNNIIAGTPTNTTPNPKDIVYVINGARSLTPTTANADTSTGSPFAPFAGPWSFVKNPAFGNGVYADEGTGTGLANPFNLTFPNFVPLTSSKIAFGTRTFNSVVRTFNPNMPINYDTTGNGVNYNVPGFPPSFTNNKASDPWFTQTNFVGAFAATQTTSDNWMAGWSNFDAQNTNYPLLPITPNGIPAIDEAVATASVYPNPTSRDANLSINMTVAGDLSVQLVDVTGKVVKSLVSESGVIGRRVFTLDLSNVQTGMYFVRITSGATQKTAKLSVIK